jgi:hypothetical protein
MRGLPTATPAAYRSLMDVKCDILGGSCSHHMSLITHIIRYYCNSPVEYDVSYAEGKYNKKGSTLVFTKVTSISIDHLSLYNIYKSCRMAIVHVAEHNPPTKIKRRTRNLFSRYGLHPKVRSYQASC